MSTLWNLDGELKELYMLAADEEDEQAFLDTLESIVGEIQVKAAGYVHVIEQLDMEAKKADEVAKMFAAKRDVRKNHIKRMKELLLTVMEDMQVTELPAGEYTIKVAKNGGLQPLKITGEVPENMTKVTIEPDMSKIRDYLKDHEADWAVLEPRGKHINIK